MPNDENIDALDPSVEIAIANPIIKDLAISKEVRVKAH